MNNREFYDSSYCTKAVGESQSLGANDLEFNFSTKKKKSKLVTDLWKLWFKKQRSLLWSNHRLTVIKPVSGITSVITPPKWSVSHHCVLGIPSPPMISLAGSSSIASLAVLAQEIPAPSALSCGCGVGSSHLSQPCPIHLLHGCQLWTWCLWKSNSALAKRS